MPLLVATNHANWDHSCFGVVGVLGAVDELESFVHRHWTAVFDDDETIQELSYVYGEEAIYDLLDGNEISRYFEGKIVKVAIVNPADRGVGLSDAVIRPDMYALIEQ